MGEWKTDFLILHREIDSPNRGIAFPIHPPSPLDFPFSIPPSPCLQLRTSDMCVRARTHARTHTRTRQILWENHRCDPSIKYRFAQRVCTDILNTIIGQVVNVPDSRRRLQLRSPSPKLKALYYTSLYSMMYTIHHCTSSCRSPKPYISPIHDPSQLSKHPLDTRVQC